MQKCISKERRCIKMKKFTKISLILAGVFAAIGIGVCIAGFGMGAGFQTIKSIWKSTDGTHFVWHGVGSEESDWKNAEETVDTFAAGDVTELEIEIKYGQVNFEKSDTDEISILVERNNGKCISKLEEGTLELKDTRSENIGNYDYNITVKIPEGKEFKKIEIENNAGTIDSSKVVLKAKTIDITVDAGEAELQDISADKVSVETGAGNTNIEKLDAQEIKIHCGLGNIDVELTDTETAYNYSMSCGLGNIDINHKSYSSVGNDKKIENNAAKNVDLDCGVGNISVKTN